MSYRVVYLGPSFPWLHDVLSAELPSGFEFVGLEKGDRAEIEAKVADADFIVALKVDAALVEKMKRVKLIQYHGVGYHGNIDVAACRLAGIPVAFTPEGNTVEVAEHVILLILAVYRQLVKAHTALRQGKWLMWELRRDSFNLAGKTVGIVGFGRIGREVARKLQGFDTQIVYYDISPSDSRVERALGARYLSLEDLMGEADVITLNVPLNAGTRGLMSEPMLQRMKPSAILINVSRGEVVDEAALCRMLQQGRIAGAGLDVFTHEPLPEESPLLKLDNVVLTPHIGSGTIDSLRAKARAWYANFSRVASGEEPLNLVPESCGLSTRMSREGNFRLWGHSEGSDS